MSVYKNKKEWNKWNEMVSASLNAIEDFRDFSDDIAIVRADKKIQSLITKNYNLERQIAEARELLLQIQDHMSQLSTHTHDGWSGSCADIVYEMIEKQLKEKGW